EEIKIEIKPPHNRANKVFGLLEPPQPHQAAILKRVALEQELPPGLNRKRGIEFLIGNRSALRFSGGAKKDLLKIGNPGRVRVTSGNFLHRAEADFAALLENQDVRADFLDQR